MTSEIPDSVSPEMLKNLLGNHKILPGSEQFPALDFGGKFGGPADLQYVMCLLIQQSSDGVNIAQMLFAALHLLAITQSHFESTVDRLDHDKPEMPTITDEEFEIIKSTMRAQAADIRDAIRAVDSVASLLGPALSAQRAQRIVEEVPHGSVMHRSEFFSRMLISDELLRSLGIDRAAISDFVEEQLQSS